LRAILLKATTWDQRAALFRVGLLRKGSILRLLLSLSDQLAGFPQILF